MKRIYIIYEYFDGNLHKQRRCCVAVVLQPNRKKPNAQLDEKRYHAWIFINELRATTCFPFFIIKMAACVCV